MVEFSGAQLSIRSDRAAWSIGVLLIPADALRSDALLIHAQFSLRILLVPNILPSRSARRPTSGPSVMGIWRLGQTIHDSKHAALSHAQPADAIGSPRWDYTVKRSQPDQVEGQRQINQFVAAASSIVHPNVVPILDASTTGTTPYLVMPRIEGLTMSEQFAYLTTPFPVALWFVRQLAQALDAIHTAGWVHGDIKPENAIVGGRGHVTLIDFGFASRVHAVPNHVYRGTPEYSSPETLLGQTAMMPAMDVFALGRILWQWLAHCEPASEAMMEPVAEMIETMVSENPAERPTANDIAKRLLRLEIETLGCHIEPPRMKRAA